MSSKGQKDLLWQLRTLLNWAGIVAYIQRLFSKKKSSGDKGLYSLFSDLLPTTIKRIKLVEGEESHQTLAKCTLNSKARC